MCWGVLPPHACRRSDWISEMYFPSALSSTRWCPDINLSRKREYNPPRSRYTLTRKLILDAQTANLLKLSPLKPNDLSLVCAAVGGLLPRAVLQSGAHDKLYIIHLLNEPLYKLSFICGVNTHCQIFTLIFHFSFPTKSWKQKGETVYNCKGRGSRFQERQLTNNSFFHRTKWNCRMYTADH